MNLSAHFTLGELTASQWAARNGYDNTPSDPALANLKRTAAFLEQVRGVLDNLPVHVNSAYRCPRVNAAVGGSKSSAHMDGRAADIVCPEFGPPVEVARAIYASGLPFDQLILEYGWVHVAIARESDEPRRQVLTKASAAAPYVPGIVG